MKEEYIIVNKTALEKMREELNKGSAHWDGIYLSDYQHGQIDLIDVIIMSKSTPLIPEIEKAMNAAREIQDDSAHDTFTAEDISGCAEVCTYGWRYKTTNKNYISNLKIDI